MYGGQLPVTGFSGLAYVAVALGLFVAGAAMAATRGVARVLKK